MVLQPDGKIILAGYAAVTDNFNLAMVRLDTAGNVDTTFGVDGKVSTDINSRPDFGKAITLQPDTKIILTGYSYAPSGIGEIVVARYENIILTTNEHQDIELQLYPNPANEQITIEFGNYSTT